MPPIRYTIESFEDVAGYPGKIFYVLHQYPGTGCPQVPFVAIDKTEGGFRVRELEQTPLETFDDEKYAFNWPRDPRLQWGVSDETEEVVSSETLPSANGKTPSMPVIQDVKSVDMEFFQKNKHTQGLMVSKDGHSKEQNGADKEFPVGKLDFESKPYVGKNTLPLSSRMINASPVPETSANDSINHNASTSRTSSPFNIGGCAASKKAGSVLSVNTEVDDTPKQTVSSLINQKASTSKSSLPVSVDGSVTSKKTGSSESTDTKVDNVPKQTYNTLITQKASTSKISLLVTVDGSVASKNTGSAESAGTKVDDVLKQTYNTLVNQKASTSRTSCISGSGASKIAGSAESVSTKVDNVPKQTNTLINQKANTSKISLPVTVDGSVTSKKTGSAELADTKVDDVLKQTYNTLVNQKASTSRTSFPVPVDGSEGTKKTGSEVSVETKVVDTSSKSINTVNQEAKTSRFSNPSSLHFNNSRPPVSVDDSKGSKKTEIAESGGHKEYERSLRLLPCTNGSPALAVDNTVPESPSPSVESTLELNKTVVKPKTKNDTVSSRDVKSIVNAASCSSELNVAPIDGERVESISATSVATVAKTDSSPVKSGQPNTVPEAVTREIYSIITNILSEHVKSGNQPSDSTNNPTVTDTETAELEKSSVVRETNAKNDSSPVGLGEKAPERETSHKEVVKEITSMVSGIISDHKKSSHSSSAYKDNPKKTREQLSEKRDKDQTSVMDRKCTLTQSKEISCLPRIARKDLCEVDNLISRAQNCVKKKGSEFRNTIEDQQTKKEKSTKGSSVEPSSKSKEAELQNKLRKSKSTERVDEQKSEKVPKKSVTSVPKIDGSGDKRPKDPDNGSVLWKRSTEPSFQSSCIGIPSSSIESQARLKDPPTDASKRPIESSRLVDSGPVKVTSGVYDVPSIDREVLPQQKSILKRRNTVDGSENRSKGRTKCVSSKYAPYNLQKYRRELEKNRPAKKTKPKNLETLNAIEKPDDDGESTTAGSNSCPSSPVSKNVKSSIEDIFNLQAILTDESSPCNYTGLIYKAPIQVASNASLDKPLGSPLEIYDNLKSTVNDTTVKANTKTSKLDSVKDSGKNSVEGPVENSEGSLSNYADVGFSKTLKHDEDAKKRERKIKMLQLMKKQDSASEIASVGVDKGGLGTSTISRTPEVGESSKYCPPTVGKHKLPAMVSSRRIQPVLPKKMLAQIHKNNGSNSGSNAELQSTKKVEMECRDNNKTTCTNNPLAKEGNVKDLPKISKVESKAQGEQLGDEAVKKQNFESSQSRKSPLAEIRKLQLALKRQKKLESPPSTSPVKNSNPTKLSKAVPLLHKNVAAPRVCGTAMSPALLDTPAVSDLLSSCPMYSDLPPYSKPLNDTPKKDVKTYIDSSKSGSTDQKTTKDHYVDKTELKNKTESPKVSSKPDVPKKCSKVSSSENKHEKLIKRSSKVGDRSEDVSPILKVGAVAAKESIDAPRMVDVGSSVDKASAVCCEQPATPAVDNISLTVESSDTVAASNSSSNVPSIGTDPLPTTESRKQLLRQLTSKITEEEIRSPFDNSSSKAIPQEGLLGMVSIGLNDLIEDKIMNVVEDIVKVKTETRKCEEKKNTTPLDPPTAEELGEFYSEIFGDAISPVEKDVTASKDSAEESNVADESLAVPVAPACTSDSMVSDPKIAEPTSDGKSGTHGDALEDEQNEPESHQKTTDTPRKPSVLNNMPSTVVPAEANAPNNLKPSPVSESSTATDELESSKVNNKSKESTNLGSCASAASCASGGDIPAPEAEITVDVDEISSQDSAVEIVDLDGITSPTQRSSAVVIIDDDGPSPSSQRNTAVEIIDVDGTSSTSQRNSAVEIIDVDCITSSSERSGVPSSRRVKKCRRVVVDELVPTIGALTRDRKLRGNRLALLRKLVARRFSIEPFCPTARNRCVNKLKGDQKHGSTVILEEHSSEAIKFSTEMTKCAVVIKKPGVIKPAAEVTKPEVIKHVVEVKEPEVIKPVRGPEVIKPVMEPEIIKPVMEPEVINPAVEVKKPEVIKPIVEFMELEVIKPAVEVTKPEVIKDVVDVNESEVIKPVMEPEIIKPVMEPDVIKPAMEPEVIKPVMEPEVTKPAMEPEVIKSVAAVTEPGFIQPLMDSKDPLSQSTVVVISEEENSQHLKQTESIPFLEDEEYPPKSVPQSSPVVMPRPFVTLYNRSRPEEDDDDVVITGVTSNTGENLLNAARNSGGRLNRLSSQRSPHEGGRQPKRMRLCAIPAPILLPITTLPPRRIVSARDRLPPVLEEMMPQPFFEFQNSPTSHSRVDTVTTPLPATSASTEQEDSPSSSSVPKRSTTNLSDKLRARLGELFPGNDAELSSHSGDSTVTRRVSFIPSVDAQSCSNTRRIAKKKRKRLQKHQRSINSSPSREGAPSTSQNDSEGAPSTSQNDSEGAPSTSQNDNEGAPSTSQTDNEILLKDTPMTDRRHLGTWRWEIKVKKKARLDYSPPRNPYPPQRSQSAEKGGRKTTRKEVRSQSGASQREDLHRICGKGGSRFSIPPKVGLNHRHHDVEDSHCSTPPEVPLIHRNRDQEESHCSTPLEVSESEVSSLGQGDSRSVGCKKRLDQRPIMTPSSTRGGLCQDAVRSTDESRSFPKRWDPPTSNEIVKVDREEAAWRNHLEDGRRFLGRRLKRFSHAEPIASRSPHSSKSHAGKSQAHGSRVRGSRRCSTSPSLDSETTQSSIKNMSSLRRQSEGKLEEPVQQAAVRKERPSPRGKGLGPGHRKGDRRKPQGGPRPILRSTAHKTRSGLIRKGDT